MVKDSQPLDGNRLLRKLEARDGVSLQNAVKPYALETGATLYAAQAPLDYAYFPLSGIISAILVMRNGDSIEVGTVGKEGMQGVAGLNGVVLSPYQVIVQVAGEALRIAIDDLRTELDRNPSLRSVMDRYQAALLIERSQSVACNGLHRIDQRCCRWLLQTHERLESDVLPLTHDFLAVMLGVRRASITDVLRPLDEKGFIRAGRGKITILDRGGLEKASCECYRTIHEAYERLLG